MWIYRYWIFVFAVLCLSCNQRKDMQLRVIDHLRLDSTLLQVEELSTGLDVPWDLDFGSDGFLWITEQAGKVFRIDPQTGSKKLVLHIKDVWKQRTTGLLALVVHPDFKNYPHIFVNYTVKRDSLIFSRLVRYTFTKDTLAKSLLLLELKGNTGHNGSRLRISPDGKLIWATGDAHDNKNAQDINSLNGKVLRLTIDGHVPTDNPYPNSYVWASGFRNIQGLTFSDKGKLYTSEHGDAIEDEVNLIKAGANYGWSVIEGQHDQPEERLFARNKGTTEPLRSWTPVIAPSGMEYYGNKTIPEWQNSLLLTTLKGKSLRVLKLDDNGGHITQEQIYFDNRYGRLRDVCAGPDGTIFISTSNRDWNPSPGYPLKGDDRILKITLSKAVQVDALKGSLPVTQKSMDGKSLYLQYCTSCHKDNGAGMSGIFPALAGSKVVKGPSSELIDVILKGKKGLDNQMPAFGFLPDAELTALLNYIRHSWGNNSLEIHEDQIKQRRKK